MIFNGDRQTYGWADEWTDRQKTAYGGQTDRFGAV